MGSYLRTLISLGLSVWLWSVKSLRIKRYLHFSSENLSDAYPGTLGHSFKKGTGLRPPPGGGVGGSGHWQQRGRRRANHNAVSSIGIR